jgi:hypothetical protein
VLLHSPAPVMLPQLTPRSRRVAAAAATEGAPTATAAAEPTNARGKPRVMAGVAARPHPSAYYIRDVGARPPVVPRAAAVAAPPWLGSGGGESRTFFQPQPPRAGAQNHLGGGGVGASARGGSIAPPAGGTTGVPSENYVGAGLHGIRKQVAAELARIQRECDGLDPDDKAVLEIHRDSFSRLIGR